MINRLNKPHLFQLSILALILTLTGCGDEQRQTAISIVGGNPDRGAHAINSYGCISCHTIPGIHAANAVVGPPLTRMGARMYIGGVLQNTPGNMMRWIEDAPAIDNKTAMPNLHITDADARDITTYLYTLQ